MSPRLLPIVASGAVMASLGVPCASAAPAGPLVITTRIMVEQRRAEPDGTTRIVLAKPERVGPGDRVVILLAYRNTGTQPLSNIALADPVPSSITFRGPHAGSAEPEVSLDGQHYAALSTPAPSSGAARSARAAGVTAVRWRLAAPLAPGGQGELAFDGVVK